MDLYDGHLRLRDADGRIVRDDVADRDYLSLITEEVRAWSYMKFPYVTALGPQAGWYKGGAAGAGAELRFHSPRRWPRPNVRPSPTTRRAIQHARRWLSLGAHDRDAARRRGDPRDVARPGPRCRRAHGRGRPRGRRRRHHRGATRHADPSLRGGRRRPGVDAISSSPPPTTTRR